MIEINNKLKGKINSSSSIKGLGIFPKGETGNGIEKIEKTNTEGLIDTYTIYYTDRTTSNFQVLNGEKGTKGDSAYQIAVKNGFEGTEESWLASLKGDKGEIGKVENRRLKLEGKSNQSVRSGKNLLKGLSTPTTDTDYWDSTTKTYFTPLKDGWGKFEYDNTSGTSNVFINASPKISSTNIKPNTQYTIVTEIRNGNISENSQAFFAPTTSNANSSSATNAIIDYININNGGIFKNLITTKTSFDNVLLAFQTYLRLPANTKGSLEVRMSLYEGNYDITNFEYEAYGASPSPDYPSKIRNIGDNINLSSGIKAGLYQIANVEYASSDYYVCSQDKIKVNSNSKIAISNKENKKGFYYILELDKDGNYIKSQNSSIAVYDYICTIGENTRYILVDIGNSKEPCTIENVGNFKVEYNVVTPYTEYNCGSIDYKLENADKTESKNIHIPLNKGQLLHERDYIDSTEIHQKKNTYSIIGNETIVISQSHTNTTLFRITALTNYKSKSPDINGICSHFKFSMVWGYDKEGIYTDGNYIYLSINNNTIGGNTVEKIKTWLAEQYANSTPVIVEYELAEEIVTPLTKEQIEAYYELQKAKYVDKMTLTCLNEIEPNLTDIDIKLEESLLDTEKSITEIKESKSIISATILKNQSNISTYKIESTDLINVTLDSPIVVGQKLKFENGKIVIGDNVKHIKVSAQVYFFDGLTSGKKSFQCLKNGETAVQSSQNVDVAYSGFGFSENVLEVSKGDVISLGLKATVNDTIYCNRNSTWITVEVVD